MENKIKRTEKQYFCHTCGELLPAKNKRWYGLCRECYAEERLNKLCEKRIAEEKIYEEFLDIYYDDRIEQRLIDPIKEKVTESLDYYMQVGILL
jgi:predicted ATP-dependent serine protease